MNLQKHITSLELEIDDNISVLIDHCFCGHIEEARVVAACIKGSRQKLKQLIKQEAYAVTKVSRPISRPKKVNVNELGSNLILYSLCAIAGFVTIAFGVWFYSLFLVL